MARQNTAPVSFSRSSRTDEGVLMSSGRAGVVVPALFCPFLRGDSGAGFVSVDINLAEMPKPLLNGTFLNVQAWFIPKSAFPQFAGTDEFLNSYTSTPIRALGAADRMPPDFFETTLFEATLAGSDLVKTLGLHSGDGLVNIDIVDAFNLVYNFRLAAHSSKLPLKPYFQQSVPDALKFPPAFWPSGRFARIVPDYEEELVVGALDLDISAGALPVRGLWSTTTSPANAGDYGSFQPSGEALVGVVKELGYDSGDTAPRIFADMANETVVTSLADIDKARTTQAFAKMRTAYAGNDSTGFMNDDMLLAHLLQGLSIPPDYWRRPWLVGSQRVAFGFAERHASDGDSLDVSVTTGRTAVRLPINVPNNDVGGYLVVTLEVLPERLDERQSEEFLYILDPAQLPNALRDVQRTVPVDVVLNRRLDTAHTAPDEGYGYEPMNDVWRRQTTRLGGVFYQPDPLNPFNESRSGIWQAGIVDPVFNEDHFLAPEPFPHDVFADTLAPAFEFVVRHSFTIVGLTQMGDVLAEDNNDYDAIVDGGLDDGED